MHSALGLLLAAFAFAHAWQNYPALESEGAWVDRALSSPLRGLPLAVLALVALGLHAALGVRSYLLQRARVRREHAEPDPGLGFQLFTGALVLGFALYHVIQLWPGMPGPQRGVLDPYAKLWASAGQPLVLGVYVIGVCALGFHAGHGLYRLVQRGRFGGALLGRALGGALGLALLFVFVQLVTRFALGEALIPALS